MDAEGMSEYYLNILRFNSYLYSKGLIQEKYNYRVSQIRWFAFLSHFSVDFSMTREPLIVRMF